MLTSTLEAIREEKARFSRDVEYLKETYIDDAVDIAFESAESEFVTESVEELEEAMEILESMEIDNEVEEAVEDEEIQRILDAEDNITFNEMVGLE